MRKFIDENKIYANEVTIVAVVDLKVKTVEFTNVHREHICSLELNFYQDVNIDINLVVDLKDRVENTLDIINYSFSKYLNNIDTSVDNEIEEIVGQLVSFEERYCNSIEILEAVDITFKVKAFDLVLDK